MLREASKNNPSNYKYRTKGGRKIRLSVEENVTDLGLNKGWILHKITAIVDGEEAGYIKISYIPSDRLVSHYPSVWHFMGLRGWSEFDPKYSKFISGTALDDRRAMLKAIRRRQGDYNVKLEDIPMSLDVVNSEIDKRAKRYFKKFEKFKQFHVDKPLVDYIYVEETWRRKGVALALYKFAARWLATRFGQSFTRLVCSNLAPRKPGIR